MPGAPCRLRRENVLFVMQARRAAHRWDAGSGMFAEDPQSEAFPTGFGVSLLQVRPVQVQQLASNRCCVRPCMSPAQDT